MQLRRFSVSMAYRRNLATRFFSMAKTSFSSRTTISNNHPLIKKKNYASNDDKRKVGFLRRFFQPAVPPEGAYSNRINIMPRIRGLEAMLPLNIPKRDQERGVSTEETKKVMRALQMEAVRARLRGLEKGCVPYSEFVEICCEGRGFEQGMGVARVLDESGDVIVLGNLVFLRPDQVAQAIERIIPLSTPKENDPRGRELEAMEAKKAKIDKEAEALVRRELWCGLGLFLLQTAGFMRLTFWELSWDVMEPVCFYVTSFYFAAGYAFFLRTSRDPSFGGFFQSRFDAKQKRLMKSHRFDTSKFDELRRACHGSSFSNPCCSCHHRDETILGVGR